ncbi:MAG: DUF6922 domain-containing protein [Bacteroidota bacterium]|jgi:hypothetical protein|nr:hypothetical protein [Saprospiraceae bacterium]
MEEKKLSIEDFSPALFWDVNKATLDPERHRRFIIERALTHGTLSDWFMVKDYYGKDLIKAESLEIRYLDRQTLAFCSAYFDEPLENFRCYKLRQSSPSHWDY